MTVAVCNQKGGVGKTTSTYNLARAAVLLGLRVLVVDLDPQGNTTSALSSDQLPEATPGIAELLVETDDYPVKSVTVPALWDGVDLVPSPSMNALSNAEEQISARRIARERCLAEALEPAVGSYDLILIDNTPAMGQLLTNALVAANRALIVSQPEQWSVDGLAELHTTIDAIRKHYNRDLSWIGPLINGKTRTAHHDRVLNEEIIPYYGVSAWTQTDELIPSRTGIKDYVLAGWALDEGPAWMRLVAEAYGRAVQRILEDGGRI